MTIEHYHGIATRDYPVDLTPAEPTGAASHYMDMTTLGEIRSLASKHAVARVDANEWAQARDASVRACYSAGKATLGQLAQATGLSAQRVHQIVREGEGA